MRVLEIEFQESSGIWNVDSWWDEEIEVSRGNPVLVSRCLCFVVWNSLYHQLVSSHSLAHKHGRCNATHSLN